MDAVRLDHRVVPITAPLLSADYSGPPPGQSASNSWDDIRLMWVSSFAIGQVGLKRDDNLQAAEEQHLKVVTCHHKEIESRRVDPALISLPLSATSPLI